MTEAPYDPLVSTIFRVATQLGILGKDGEPAQDPEEITDEYLNEVYTRTRAFVVLCSSELEEFFEARCLSFLSDCVEMDSGREGHNCIHALSIHFRANIGNLLESGHFVDFYATPNQAGKFAKELRARKRAGSDDEVPILNRKTLVAKLCVWYRDNVVRVSHGISDSDLMTLLAPLGFSRHLVKEECPTLCAALQSLAAARGEAAHRAGQSSGWPFKGLAAPLEQQLSASDAWGRWIAVVDALYEFEDLIKIRLDTTDSSAEFDASPV
ncbi:hypothetical protein ACIRYZ_02240 [Kitasatospora sp. NPDC101155]|uniref:hypothetical protein n=1 Tax=Kitasatospora sp. NPDC101155 TaxID=3364097 RepID=UPI0038244D19